MPAPSATRVSRRTALAGSIAGGLAAMLTPLMKRAKPAVIDDSFTHPDDRFTLPGHFPADRYIRGDRYEVPLTFKTPRFTKDVNELKTWKTDIRQVLSDNAIKDMVATKDSNGFYELRGVNWLITEAPTKKAAWSAAALVAAVAVFIKVGSTSPTRRELLTVGTSRA